MSGGIVRLGSVGHADLVAATAVRASPAKTLPDTACMIACESSEGVLLEVA